MSVALRPSEGRSSSPALTQPAASKASSAAKANAKGDQFEGATAPKATLARGMTGTGVKKLQDDLVKLKFMTSAAEATGPGIFGPRTEASVKAFQSSVHLPSTGVYDARTRHALSDALEPKAPTSPTAPTAPSSGPGPVPKGTAAQYAYFAKMAGKNLKTGPDQMNLIGFRKHTSTFANGGAGLYDDKLVMIWKDAQGNPHVKKYTYNTEPAQDFESTAKDVNGDGRGDLGRIPAGFHTFELSTRAGTGAPCLRTAQGDFQVERDTNHDGRFNEHVLSSGGALFLFHEGGTSGTFSQGCQTFAPDQWNAFWHDVSQAHGTIGYTLRRGIPDGL